MAEPYYYYDNVNNFLALRLSLFFNISESGCLNYNLLEVSLELLQFSLLDVIEKFTYDGTL